MADTEVQITLKDAEAFSAKLSAWGASLDAKEKALLHVLIKSAAAGAPGGELSDGQLSHVAGGAGSPFQQTALNVLQKFVGTVKLPPGGAAFDAGGSFRPQQR